MFGRHAGGWRMNSDQGFTKGGSPFETSPRFPGNSRDTSVAVFGDSLTSPLVESWRTT